MYGGTAYSSVQQLGYACGQMVNLMWNVKINIDEEMVKVDSVSVGVVCFVYIDLVEYPC